jgi:histidinol-phosphate aminotransferase
MASTSSPPPLSPLRAYSVGDAPDGAVRRLHLNEFRFPHAARVQKHCAALAAELGADALLTHYPSGPLPALAERLAEYVGAESKNVVVAPGSDEILRGVLDTCALRGHTQLLHGVPGYTHFEHYAALHGLEMVSYSIGIDTPAAAHEAALRYHADLMRRGCLVYLGSPNNPTGDLWSAAAVAGLAVDFPRSLFVVDEAYTEFAAAEKAAQHPTEKAAEPPAEQRGADTWAAHAAALNSASAVAAALKHGNVVVTRTLSKAFGLAALRVGYSVSTPELAAQLQIAVTPKGVSQFTARAALTVFDALRHYRECAAEAVAEGRRAVAALCALGWTAHATAGNFYLVHVGDDVGAAAQALLAAGVQVRRRDELAGLAGYVRVTSGPRADTDAVLAAFATLTPPAQRPFQALYTDKAEVAALKTLLRRALAVLDMAAVPVWAQGGTMLGMVRHRGGMIPTDNDVDLAYARCTCGALAKGLAQDPCGGADPLEDMRDLFRAAGLTLQRNGSTQQYWQVGTNDAGAAISPQHIDVFPYFLRSDARGERFVLTDERFQEEKPAGPWADCDTTYARDELFPLQPAKFYDLDLPLPHKAAEVLLRACGADCMRVARVRVGTREAGRVEEYALRDSSPA